LLRRAPGVTDEKRLALADAYDKLPAKAAGPPLRAGHGWLTYGRGWRRDTYLCTEFHDGNVRKVDSERYTAINYDVSASLKGVVALNPSSEELEELVVRQR